MATIHNTLEKLGKGYFSHIDMYFKILIGLVKVL